MAVGLTQHCHYGAILSEKGLSAMEILVDQCQEFLFILTYFCAQVLILIASQLTGDLFEHPLWKDIILCIDIYLRLQTAGTFMAGGRQMA